MSKTRGYRQKVGVVDESIPEEVKEEIVETVTEIEEPVLMGPITVEEETKKPIDTVSSAGTVLAFRLNIRKSPSVDSEIVKVLKFKDDIEILDESTTDGWVSVLCSDGTKGYCMKKFIKTIK